MNPCTGNRNQGLPESLGTICWTTLLHKFRRSHISNHSIVFLGWDISDLNASWWKPQMLDVQQSMFCYKSSFTRARKTVHLDAWSFLNENELGNSVASTHNCNIYISLKQNEHHIKLRLWITFSFIQIYFLYCMFTTPA